MSWGALKDDVQVSCIAEFGEPLILVVDEDEYPVTGIFKRDPVVVEPESGVRISTNQPEAWLRIADLPGEVPQVMVGHRITHVGGHRVYEVVDVQEDGHGMVRIVLEKVGSA